MKSQANSKLDKIAAATAASKAGLLANYAPAKFLNSDDSNLPQSWGPAMRV